MVFALIMLSIMIVIAAGSFSASVLSQKTSNDSTKSVSAFQAADTGVENAFRIINERVRNGGAQMTLSAAGLCNTGSEYINDGVLLPGRKFTVSYYVSAGKVIDCSTTKIQDLISLKSVGEHGGTVRAVSVDVESPGDCTGTVSKDGLIYGKVLAADGKCWLDRNLGASRIANVMNDSQAYGWYFQWGRGADGHQISTSGVTTTRASSDNPGHANFISTTAFPFDWRNPVNNSLWQGVSGINNPCPIGFRVPTRIEWNDLISAEIITNRNTAFSSSLKFPMAGIRNGNGAALFWGGNEGDYWTSSPNGSTASFVTIFDSISVRSISTSRSSGFSVRCLQD